MLHLEEYDSFQGIVEDLKECVGPLTKAIEWDELISMSMSFEVKDGLWLSTRNSKTTILRTDLSMEAFEAQLQGFKDPSLILGPSFGPLSEAVLQKYTASDLVNVRAQHIEDYLLKHPEPLKSEFTITRETNEDNLQAKIDIESAAFKYPESYLARLRNAIIYMGYGTTDREEHFIVRDGGLPVAYMSIRYRDGVAYLQGAAVLESHRRRGINSFMTDQAMRRAWEKGYKIMGTSAWDAVAVTVWEGLGFNLIGHIPIVQITSPQ
ncbi:hypothetical protein EDD86DRAFT_97533 [Gorgonomyces haynaldii]|nr:hypothetical protein EDD86DRAFT_97533 [Gorgonomyces haynaldii]